MTPDCEFIDAIRASKRINLNGGFLTLEILDVFLQVLKVEGSCSIEGCAGSLNALQFGALLSKIADAQMAAGK